MGSKRNLEQQTIVPGVKLPASAIRFSYARSSGPGGQHVNKVNTKVTLTVHCEDFQAVMPSWALQRLIEAAGWRLARRPDRIRISASRSRSQRANREACLLKLRKLVIAALKRPSRRRRTRPTTASVGRRLNQKTARGQLKVQRRCNRDPERD